MKFRTRINPAIEARIPKMADIEEHGQFVVVTCGLCRKSHRYYPRDIQALLGNVPFLNIEQYFHCVTCDEGLYMKAKLETPSAKERNGLVVRRLVEVKTVRRPVWRDEKL